ncbi:2-polyprenyl-6-methoxyphenol hydroxylase [Streptoalloteichus tenebrarius]|uniref:2-polyprenyl-6-methoxyphenol hydroxylase n=1 Tax=Streptoalloteichus tenebrarius (strain ATCC 17920 / DSM 40477 / JCM 4838 / CBS 697.72 / NBRC 16177 / NCIMB 11028 / NRRL B-12390 / A12253. 1 / ISP 5477) TaxID=1933 RepID=A0ABT1HXL1_STRSD|nr:FAD-dependent monooxygenase [Streptoalloteichus tenebrarius]MCP2260261.1 2-polyprenyl-6-methoxyphenol hydroxylase [Streptoalloteichus tenebrarius]BFF03010.1 FAD-dependent monooxygenase [Streptoalloteichus tenebrarius]
MIDERVPVLIVGGGLAGLTTALFLGLHGVRPLLVEKHASTTRVMKARGQYPHAMEAMRVAGVADQLRAAGPGGTTDFYMVVAQSLAGPVLTSIMTSGEMSMRHVSPEDWSMASQERTEPILAERARELGARLCFSTALRSFEQDDEGVTAVVENVGTGGRRVIRADYLVGADGRRSPVREGLGVGTHGRGVLGHLLRVFFDADMTEPLAQLPGVAQGRKFALFHLLNEETPGIFYTTDVPGRYGYIRGLSRESTDHRSLPEEWFVDLVRRGLDLPDLELKIVETGETPLVESVADSFGVGRAFLVGDAAKVVPAPGGLGGSTAIMDGFYLAWKLAAVVRGQAGPGLLVSHDAERRPVADMIAEQQFANTLERLAPELDDGTAAEIISPVLQVFGYRCAHGAVVREPGDAGELIEDPTRPTGRPGSRAPYVPLRDNGRPTCTTWLFGQGFVLLVGADAPAWERDAAEVAARLGIRLDVRRVLGPDHAGPGLVDPEGAWTRAYGISERGAALVRPDRFVAWRSVGECTATELERALRIVLDRSA